MYGNEHFGLLFTDNGQKVSLQGISVNVVIGHMIGHVECVLLYKNTRPNAIETVFKFPLDDGSAIYKMEADFDGKVIVAECQEKQQAQQTYDMAKQSGMTAFLLKEDDNSGDIFTCYLGNLPTQKEARLTIAYVSELTRESDGFIKFTLPTVLNPRYQSSTNKQQTGFGTGQFGFGGFQTNISDMPNELLESGMGDYSFSLNIDIQSQFEIGSLTSETPEIVVQIQEPDKTRAKASYSTEKCNLTTDLSLLIKYEDNNQPTAIIERGSRGQDGLMKSDMLLLNFYPEVQENTRKSGEFIFVIDRSGSMSGSNILNAVQTLMLLVKSIRVGCYFNIVSFGSHYDQLFQKSVVYNKENMTTAVNLINRMGADMGGTELASPLTSVFSQPLIPDHPRQLFVITDGAISNVNQTLDLVKKNSKNARVFSVGIGQGASTALVKGLARAGNGRYQFVTGEDRLQQKVMNLMKFSLQPQVKNLKLDWTLSQGVSALFVITDGAISNVNQTLDLVKKNSKNARVFSVGIGQGASTALVKGLARAGNGRYQFVTGEDRLQQKVMNLMKFSLQPQVKNLKLDWTLSQGVSAVTVPQQLPNLFVGEMITLYAIITGAERHEIVGGTIKMNGEIGEDSFEYLLEFEGQGHIDDTTAAAPIHRLAAKAWVKDLEIEEMASTTNINKKSEIVLASVSANIISKYTSFVGVDKESKVVVHQTPQFEPTSRFMFGSAPAGFGGTIRGGTSLFGSKPSGFGAGQSGQGYSGFGSFGGMPTQQAMFGGAPAPGSMGGMQSQQALFGGAPAPGSMGGMANQQDMFGGVPALSSIGGIAPQQDIFGSAPAPCSTGMSAQDALFGGGPPTQNALFGGGMFSSNHVDGSQFNSGAFGGARPSFGFGGQSQQTQQSTVGFGLSAPTRGSANNQAMLQDEVIAVISLQEFEGSWENSEQLRNLLKLPEVLTQSPKGIDSTHWMTCVVLVWLEIRHMNRNDEWELLSKKASDWLISEIGPNPLTAYKLSIYEQMKKL